MSGPTLIASARSALQAALRGDQRVRVLGEDVTAGGPFGLTKTLVKEFGTARICNTPISEGAIMGAAIGLALGGERPFVDLMFCDFLTAASDQLFNHAAKINFMSGGRYSVPLTVWTIGGAGTRWGAQHSQRLDGWLTQVPGLKVLAPASAAAAAKAIEAAFDDPDPVVVIADRALLYRKDELPGDGDSPWNTRTCLRAAESGRERFPRFPHRRSRLSSPLFGRAVDTARECSLVVVKAPPQIVAGAPLSVIFRKTRRI